MTENELVEHYKRAMEIHKEEFGENGEDSKAIDLYKTTIELIEEIQQYRSIGTVEECREAREKQREKKPITYKGTNRADCPVCGSTARGISVPFGNWCSKCGQSIDWSDSP